MFHKGVYYYRTPNQGYPGNREESGAQTWMISLAIVSSANCLVPHQIAEQNDKNGFVLLPTVCYHCLNLLFYDWRLHANPAAASVDPMNKLSLTLLLVFVLGLVVFATWQLFAGNLEASFSTLPFLLIIYLFVLKLRRSAE